MPPIQAPAAAALHKANEKYNSIITAINMDNQPVIATRNALITVKKRKEKEHMQKKQHR